jgi:hypothetical protein
MKKKNPFKKSTSKPSAAQNPTSETPPPTARIAAAAIPTLYRAWCDTQSVWISPDWTTMDQANADAETHANMGHLVEVKQKIG